MSKFILFLSIIIFSLFLAGITLAQETQGNLPSAPKTLGESGDFAMNLIKPLPSALKSAGQDPLRLWNDLWLRVKKTWDETMGEKIDYFLLKIKNLIKKEVENRKPIIKEGLEEEKQEITQEAKTEGLKFGKGFWDQLKGLIGIE